MIGRGAVWFKGSIVPQGGAESIAPDGAGLIGRGAAWFKGSIVPQGGTGLITPDGAGFIGRGAAWLIAAAPRRWSPRHGRGKLSIELPDQFTPVTFKNPI
jgi:hypothetical protein